MSLRLIYGKAGTGKSTFIFKEIQQNLQEKNRKYIITPEQFSYSAEKKLLEITENKSVINTEVITFKRMAERTAVEVGGKTEITLTKSGKAMLIYSILEKQKGNLQFLQDSETNVELAMQSIKEFKKHGISKEILKQTIERIANPLLKIKLEDINKIYENYENHIEEKFIDEEDALTKLAKRLKNSKMFDNSEIYIDEFSGFTKQEYNIIKELLKKAKRVTVAFCMDNLEKGQKETDIFYPNKETWEKLKDISKEVNIEIEEQINFKKNYKFKSKELLHLEQNIYSLPYKIYDENVENIKLFLTANPYSEIEEIAKTIVKLVRDEGYKYSDIAIITKDIDGISSTVKAILTKNNIPIFIDKKEDLAKSQIIKYILAILEIFAKNWLQEAVISYIKSGLLQLEENEIYQLENYVIKWGIKGSKWYKEDWKYEEENPNGLRKKIVGPLLKLKENLDKEKTARSISKVLYKFLEENKIYEKIEEKIKKYEEQGEILVAKNYKASFEILIDVIDEIVSIYQDEKMTFTRYKELLKIGLSYKELGNIPEVIDQVILGDIERTRSHKIKVAFIINLNDGIFPQVNKSEGFLNDQERELLKQMGNEIAKGTLDLLYEEQFNIYKALTTAQEKLYLYLTSTDKEGKSLRPSILITKIKKVFPKLKEQSYLIQKDVEIASKESTFEELLQALKKLKDGEEINNIWYEIYNWYKNNKEWNSRLEKALEGINYTNIPEKITEENIEKLYGKTLKTSVSKLETYRKCPFSFYLKYGLKLKEKEEYKIRNIDTGTFMHEVVDEFFKRVSDVHLLQKNEIHKIVEQVIEEKLQLKKNYLFTSSKKFIVLTNRLKSVINKSIEYIVYQIQNSDFNVLSNELEFSKTINNIEITGKIDRVDLSKDGSYIRIIDYKSSSKNINLNEALAGIQIQLLTYMDVIQEKLNKTPAGVLYFNLIEPIISSNKMLSIEEIEEKIKAEFRMKGLILADIKVVKLMDRNLTKGSSDIIPAYIDKDGNLSTAKPSMITKEEFSKLQIKIRKIIEDISKEILNGNIDITPINDRKTKNTACKYCQYKSICGFNVNINCYNYLENKTKEEILSSLK